jgi:WD40 repeat protein
MIRTSAAVAVAIAALLPACTIYLGGDDDDPGGPAWPDAAQWWPDAGPDAGYLRPDAPPFDCGVGVDGGGPDAVVDPVPGDWEFAFLDAENGDQAVMLGNTSGQRAAFAAPSYSLQYLAVSPTGTHVAVGSFEDGWKLRVLGLVDGSSRVIGRGDLEGPPSWSPDGTQLTYSWRAWGGDVAPSVVRASLDGSVFEIIEQGAPGSFSCITPSWSPDGREIAYPIGGTVRVRTVATGATRTVATGVAEACKPTWSPDGRAIAFTYGTTTARLALVGARGGPVRNLTSLYNYQSYARPAWSPDGRSLVYIDYDPALPSFSLREVNVAGGAPTTLFAVDDRGGAARWSPDGGSILAVRYEGGMTLALWDVATRTVRSIGGSAPGYGARDVSWLPVPFTR